MEAGGILRSRELLPLHRGKLSVYLFHGLLP